MVLSENEGDHYEEDHQNGQGEEDYLQPLFCLTTKRYRIKTLTLKLRCIIIMVMMMRMMLFAHFFKMLYRREVSEIKMLVAEKVREVIWPILAF